MKPTQEQIDFFRECQEFMRGPGNNAHIMSVHKRFCPFKGRSCSDCRKIMENLGIVGGD